jgi:hypothetical protein
MKKKLPAPHDVVKSYLKVAQKAIEDALFVRPEWRQPASLAAVDLAISRLDEVYFPFSTRDKHMVAVWKQVLKEKREEMLEGIKPKKEQFNNRIFIEGGTLAPSNLSQIAADAFNAALWTKQRIAKLKADVKARRCGSWIAREIKSSPSIICSVLNGTGQISLKKRSSWLDRIDAAFKKRHDLIQSAANKAVESKVDEFKAAHIPAPDPSYLTFPQLKSILDFPQKAATLISNMSVDIIDGKLQLQVVVNVDEAIKLAVQKMADAAKAYSELKGESKQP